MTSILLRRICFVQHLSSGHWLTIIQGLPLNSRSWSFSTIISIRHSVKLISEGSLTKTDHMKKIISSCLFFFMIFKGTSQGTDQYILLKPDRVFDGEQMQTGWVVLVK